MLMLIVALLAALGLINPVNHAAPTPQFESLRYAVATIHSNRIARDHWQQAAAFAEAQRIQRVADAEATALAAAITAQREAAEAAALASQREAAAIAAQQESARVAALAAQRTVQQAQAAAPTAQPLRVAPQPVAPVAQPSSPGRYTGDALRAALAQTSWPSGLWSTVEYVVPCESGGQTTAVSPGGHRGLMQVDPRLHGAVPSDAVGQLEQAYGVYLQQGWGAWSCA